MNDEAKGKPMEWKEKFRKLFVKGYPPSTVGGVPQDAEAWVDGYPEEVESFIASIIAEKEKEIERLKEERHGISDVRYSYKDEVARLQSQLSEKDARIKELESDSKIWSALKDTPAGMVFKRSQELESTNKLLEEEKEKYRRRLWRMAVGEGDRIDELEEQIALLEDKVSQLERDTVLIEQVSDDRFNTVQRLKDKNIELEDKVRVAVASIESWIVLEYDDVLRAKMKVALEAIQKLGGE